MRSTRGAASSLAPARRAGASAALLLLLPLLCLPGTARGDAGPDYLAELLTRSDEAGLADAEQWHQLLHMRRPPWSGGPRSHADDRRFFLAESGPRDPRAELHATLVAFFADPEPGSERQHPQCAFPARYRWLDQRLGFDPERLPRRECPAWRAARAQLGEVDGVTLIFAEAFMNNPASMFGHTLLRIDNASSRGGRGLLGWAVNFSGETGQEAGPLYAVKGIVGLYPGYYSIAPYYEKVKEYGDWENRDIWEYRLTLSPDEVEFLLMHLWELQRVSFDYYYFDENCSYQLLALLQTVRPGLRLTDGYPLWVIPSDTVRSVVTDAGLLGSVEWRPSAATRLRSEARPLARSELATARRIAEGDLDPEDPSLAELPEARRAQLLEVAYDWLRHRYLAKEVTREESAGRARRILVARSRVDVQGSPAPPPEAPEIRPDEGHGSSRISLAGGWEDDRGYIELRLRPAFHDLLDPDGGYTPGAEIEMFDLALRVYPGSGRFQVQELVALDLVSLVPWDGLFRPISYRFDTGLRTRRVPDGRGRLESEPLWSSRGGAGLSASLGRFGLAYGLAESVLQVGGSLSPDVAFGAGGSVGLLLGPPGGRWKGRLSAEAVRFFAGDRTTALSAGFEQRVSLARRLALRAGARYERDFGRGWVEASLRFDYYFRLGAPWSEAW